MEMKFNPFTGKPDYTGKDYGQEIEAINRRIDDLHYEAIAFTSAPACSPAIAELGRHVQSVTITWKLNKTPRTLTVDGQQADTSLSQKTLAGLDITAARTFTVIATDEREAEARRDAAISFCNSLYYGVDGPEAGQVDLDTFTTRTQAARAITFSVNAGAGEHIFFALPKRYGTPAFNVGGFDGGFSLQSEYEHTNASGYKETYLLYRSDNAALGQTTVKVS